MASYWSLYALHNRNICLLYLFILLYAQERQVNGAVLGSYTGVNGGGKFGGIVGASTGSLGGSIETSGGGLFGSAAGLSLRSMGNSMEGVEGDIGRLVKLLWKIPKNYIFTRAKYVFWLFIPLSLISD